LCLRQRDGFRFGLSFSIQTLAKGRKIRDVQLAVFQEAIQLEWNLNFGRAPETVRMPTMSNSSTLSKSNSSNLRKHRANHCDFLAAS